MPSKPLRLISKAELQLSSLLTLSLRHDLTLHITLDITQKPTTVTKHVVDNRRVSVLHFHIHTSRNR